LGAQGYVGKTGGTERIGRSKSFDVDDHDDDKIKQNIRGRTNRLLFFDTTRTEQNKKKSQELLGRPNHILSEGCDARAGLRLPLMHLFIYLFIYSFIHSIAYFCLKIHGPHRKKKKGWKSKP
jgi:hypothetical protein